jgi:S1-C subfamily serine protease
VAVDSFAHRLGLRPSRVPIQIGDSEIFIGGDILLEVQGIPISSSIQETCRIRDKMGGVERGGYMEVKVLREGRVINLRAAK